MKRNSLLLLGLLAGATMYTGGLNSVPPYDYGNIKKWDVPSRTESYTLTSSGSVAIGRTNALAVTPDGTAFASGHGSVRCPAEGPCVDFAIGFDVWNADSSSRREPTRRPRRSLAIDHSGK